MAAGNFFLAAEKNFPAAGKKKLAVENFSTASSSEEIGKSPEDLAISFGAWS